MSCTFCQMVPSGDASMISLRDQIVHDERTASTIIEKEAVILTLQNSMIHTLNRVGSRMWQLADGTRSVEEIAAVISDEFQVDEATAHADILEFVGELRNKGMIAIQRVQTSEEK